jgi:hypothetical protein
MSYSATKVMLIRHAEKPIRADTTSQPPTPAYNGIDDFGNPDKDSLIPRGWQRAGALISLFTSSSGPLPEPQFLFAPNMYGKGTSKRPYETITPLAERLGLVINGAQDPKSPGQYSKDDYTLMLASATVCSGVVLISWEHGEIPNVANWLLKSGTAPKWPGDRFDMVRVFDLTPAGDSYALNQVPQLLLATDLPAPILPS